MLRLKLFGSFELGGPDGPIVLASSKLPAFLAYLALSGKPVPRDQITELLWGSHFEDQARQNFRQALSRLRKLLGADLFAAEDQFIQLRPGVADIDVAQFETLSRSAAAEELRAAVGLAGGELLEGIHVREEGFAEWLAGERRRLAKLVAETLLKLGEAELAEGQAGAALERADAVAVRDPYSEPACRLAMRALAALERRPEALRRLQDFAGRLQRDLGSEPARETTELAGTIRSAAATAPRSAEADRPSLAVMPFANLGGDPEQDYFADGMVDELIIALSHVPRLFVIARSSSFTYKGRNIDARQAGRELGVRYVLEGSVRRAGTQLRISGQLIDAATGVSLWADRFDGELKDIFDLQDRIAARVVAAIAPKLEQAELERSRRKPTGSLDAYDYYLRGMICSHAWTRAANREALTHFYRAIELDPHFAAAYGMAARSFAQRKTSSWVEDWEGEMREAERLAYLAIEFGRDDAVALATAGITIAFMIGRVEEGDRLIQRSLALNPGFAWGWLFGGWTAAWMGDADTAIARVEHAIALSPFDPNLPSMRRAIAFAHFVAGRYDEALRIAGEVPASPRNASLGIATLAASAAMLGDVPLAQGHLVELMSIERDLRLNNLRARFPLLHDADHQRFAEGLRLAGLPET